jgi:hypothetical protein
MYYSVVVAIANDERFVWNAESIWLSLLLNRVVGLSDLPFYSNHQTPIPHFRQAGCLVFLGAYYKDPHFNL